MTEDPTRVVRVLHEGSPRYGVLDGTEVALIDSHPFAPYRTTGERLPVQHLRLLAPVIPSKIVAVAENYRDGVTAAEAPVVDDEPLLFLKPSTSVIGPGEPIRLPTEISHVFQHGAGLGVVIGALLQRVDAEEAMAGVLGYTCGNDVTARDAQDRERQWFRAKGFDSSCPLGPAIATGMSPSGLAIRCSVDGEVRQDAVTDDLVWGVAELVSEISQVMTLLPSDVVLTGTPPGVGPVAAGQNVRVEIEGIGVLDNPVVDRSAATSGHGNGDRDGR